MSAKKLPRLLQNVMPQPGWTADRITAVEQLAERRLPPRERAGGHDQQQRRGPGRLLWPVVVRGRAHRPQCSR
ncbi:hypothetical protein AB0G85_37715 [Streptomyces sioyaensis]|uniref:hypothetical protein n=1 Tax=Streptomyces sioyaensis TaxID=67364 RepID=UPI0033EEA758